MTRKLVSKKELKSVYGVPYSFAHIARLEAAGSFPSRVTLGACRVAWVADEVETRIEERTRPILVFMAREKDDGRYKIFIRSHLFSNSPLGRVIESMYVRLHNRAGSHLFDFWGYGETDKLSLSSGLFVGQTGVTYNHHFVLRRDKNEFLSLDGDYRLEVFANVLGNRLPSKLMEIDLAVDSQTAAEMIQIVQLGAFFEGDADAGNYTLRLERRQAELT